MLYNSYPIHQRYLPSSRYPNFPRSEGTQSGLQHTDQVKEMTSTNNLGRPQDLSPSEVSRIFGGMSPLQATRYYNKCMTNPNTPDANLNLLRQFRAQNPNKFLSDDQMKGSRKSQGSWLAGKGYSGGYRGRNNGRVYSDGYSYDNQGNAYDPSGNVMGGWQDGGEQRQFYPRKDSYVMGGGFFRRKSKSIDQARSIDEIGETLKGFNDPYRGRMYVDKIINNPDSNPETVKNAKHFIEAGSTFIANDEQMAQYRANRPQGAGGYGNRSNGYSGGRRNFRFFQRKPVDQPRSPNEVNNTLSHLKDNVSRTRYYDKVMNNPYSNPETVNNLIAYRESNPQLFASADEVANAPHRDSMRSRFWMPKEEFDSMSSAKKKFFVGAVNRNSRAKNTAFSLRVITDPETTTSDRTAMVQVVREHPLLFFKNPKPLRRQQEQF